jgi:cell wall-associated NlpC family hydrolase
VKGVLAGVLGAGALCATLGVAVVASALSVIGVGPEAPTAQSDATAQIPPAMVALYQQASVTCPGLPWTVLAAIGTVESDNGQSVLAGVHSGANAAGAEGPMQFEPATFSAYDRPVPPGGAAPPSPYDAVDAVYAAARLLCANGAANGADLSGAVYAYNHSPSYVDQVLSLAELFGGTSDALPPTGAGAEAVAVHWALAQIGTPYVWGGEATGVGFDCSGLVQAAYRVAGVALPRVAEDQYDDTAKVPAGAALVPGDLVFFGASVSAVDHVGLYVGIVGGQELMVDAPYTGADVRAESFPDRTGAPFGDLRFVGATRP